MPENPFHPPEMVIEESPAPLIDRDRPEYLVGDAVIFWESFYLVAERR